MILNNESSGQNINRQMVNQLTRSLEHASGSEEKIRILIELGKFHTYKAGELVIDLDSAVVFLNGAREIALENSLTTHLHDIESLLQINEMERGNVQTGRARFDQLIKECKNSGDLFTAAIARRRMGVWLGTNSNYYNEVFRLYQEALQIFRELKDEENEIYMMREIATLHINQGKIQQAEEELLEVLRRYTLIRYPKKHYTYNLLSIVSRLKGNYNKGLLYSIKCIESMLDSKDTLMAAGFYGDLARMYNEVGNKTKSVENYKLSLSKWRQEGLPNFAVFMACRFIILDYIQRDSAALGLNIIRELANEIHPITFIQKACVAQNMAYCYEALKKFDSAEIKYLEALNWYRKTNMDFEMSQESEFDAGRFYLSRLNYSKAGLHLRKALNFDPQKNSLSTLKDLHLMLYIVDSVEGRFVAAMSHFRQHKILNDSIFSTVKSRQIEELQIKYASEEKEASNKVLLSENKLQQSKLRQAEQTKKGFYAGLILFLVILLLILNQYRIRKRNNNELHLKQKEITRNNYLLKHLLEEKEWLLREINHRVGNNLQTVMSLLESQSAYLEDDALKAIRASQNRINTMSLIHHRLYQSDNLRVIEMSEYIPELISFVEKSFDIAHSYNFQIQVNSVKLEAAQAIPVGLIVNEAVTNAMKYAFPGTNKGTIFIAMTEKPENRINLIIRDNGIGLPKGFDLADSDSLGMKLMQGLSEDIAAEFAINNEGGTKITVSFTREVTAEHIP